MLPIRFVVIALLFLVGCTESDAPSPGKIDATPEDAGTVEPAGGDSSGGPRDTLERGVPVAGFERSFRTADADPVEGGLLLMGELGCLGCHDAGDLFLARIANKSAPRLNGVASRVDPYHIEKLLLEFAGGERSRTMPAVLAHLPESERVTVAGDLVHFLASRSRRPFQRVAPDEEAAARGDRLYHEVGCAACHEAHPEGTVREEVAQDGTSGVISVPLPPLVEKYSVDGLREFLRDPLKHRPSGRMPDLKLSDREARDIAQYLLRETRIASPLRFEEFHGHRRTLDDRSRMQRRRTGVADGFEL